MPKDGKRRAVLEDAGMYRMNRQMRIEDFVFPYGRLDKNNEWVKLADLVPWDEAEEVYAKQFVNNGNPAHPARIALGALIIKQELQCSDEWTVRHVSENPYLQYCLGLKEYTSKCPFGASTTVELRKRFPFLLCWQLPPLADVISLVIAIPIAIQMKQKIRYAEIGQAVTSE